MFLPFGTNNETKALPKVNFRENERLCVSYLAQNSHKSDIILAWATNRINSRDYSDGSEDRKGGFRRSSESSPGWYGLDLIVIGFLESMQGGYWVLD